MSYYFNKKRRNGLTLCETSSCWPRIVAGSSWLGDRQKSQFLKTVSEKFAHVSRANHTFLFLIVSCQRSVVIMSTVTLTLYNALVFGLGRAMVDTGHALKIYIYDVEQPCIQFNGY